MAAYKRGNPGCQAGAPCACSSPPPPCGGTICVTVTTCDVHVTSGNCTVSSTPPLSGASVCATLGAASVCATTDASGVACVSPPSAGTWTVTVSASGKVTQTFTVVFNCGDAATASVQLAAVVCTSLPTTIYLTHDLGTVTLTRSTGSGDWTGSGTYAFSAVSGSGCGVPVSVPTYVTLTFHVICTNGCFQAYYVSPYYRQCPAGSSPATYKWCSNSATGPVLGPISYAGDVSTTSFSPFAGTVGWRSAPCSPATQPSGLAAILTTGTFSS